MTGGPFPDDIDTTPDDRAVEFGVDFFKRSHDRPFLLAVGLFRPHMPFHVPPKYFAPYPPDSVVLPKRPADDLDDIPAGGKKLLERSRHWWTGILDAEAERPGVWRDSVRAYQASATFADHQLGRLLTALARSPYADNTIIVVWFGPRLPPRGEGALGEVRFVGEDDAGAAADFGSGSHRAGS